MGLNGVVSGYPTSMNLPWVDGLSTDPQDLGCHNHIQNTHTVPQTRSFLLSFFYKVHGMVQCFPF